MPDYSAGTASVDISPDFRNFVRELRAELDTVTAELGVDIHPDTSRFAADLNTELSKVKAEFDVQILPDITGFSAELGTELSKVNADLNVDIHPDLTGFAAELGTELSKVTAELDVQIHPDVTGFATDLNTELSKVNSEHDVRINPDTTGFETDLDTKLAGITKEYTVNVKPDVDQAALDALEAKIQAKLDKMRLGVTVRVDADTKTAAAEIAALKKLVRRLTLGVDADTTAARAEIDRLNGRTVRVNVHADGAGGGQGGLSKYVLPAALGLSQLPAAATALTSIGADIQALTQSVALLPGLFAGAAAGALTLSVGLDHMKDAFSDSPKKAAKAYAALSDEGKHVVDTLKDFGPQWDRIKDKVQDTTLDGLAKPLDGLLKSQLPALESGMTGLSGKFNGIFKTAIGELSNGKSVFATGAIFGNTTAAAGELNRAVTPIISSFRTLAVTGSGFLPQLASGFANAATKFDAFITKSQQTGDLSRWIQESITAIGQLGSILHNLGSSLSSVFRANKDGGETFLGTMDRLTTKMSAFLKSTEGQTGLRAFFIEGHEQMDSWTPILSSLGTILGSVYEGTRAWSALLLPFLTAAASLLGNHQGLVTGVVTAYLAFRTLSPILAGVQGAVTTFTTAMSTAATAGAGAFRSSIAGLTAVLGGGGLFGIALAAAAIGLGFLAQKHQEAKAAADAQRAALEQLGSTLDKQTGKVTEQTVAAGAEQLEKGGFLNRATTLGVDTHAYTEASLGLAPEQKEAINQKLTQIILEQVGDKKFGEWTLATNTGLTDVEVAQAIQGIPDAVKKYEDAGLTFDLAELKAKLNDVGESAATLGGEMNGVDSTLAKMGESALRTNEAMNGTFQLTAQGTAAFADLGLAVQSVPDAKTVTVSSTSDEQKKKLEELGYTVTTLPDGTVKIVLSDEAARAGIAQITAPATKTVNVVVNQGSLNTETLQRLHENIDNVQVAPKAFGGEISGGVAGRDSVPLLGMPGEHMLTTSDVDKLGGQAGVYRFRSALQAGLVKGFKSGGAVSWTAEDETKLQSAITAVEQAKNRSEKKQTNPKASQADKDQAELAITKAQQKVDKLQAQKDGTGSAANAGTTYPQADLPSAKTDTQISIENAKASVDKANTDRNKIYADGNSSDAQKLAADNAYLSAQNSLTSAQKKSSSSDSSSGLESYSLQGIFSKAGGYLADGLLSALGLENSILSSNNTYNKAATSIINHYTGDSSSSDTSGSGYTPQNLTVDDDSSTGAASKDDTDSAPSGTGAARWRPTFASVLSTLDMPAEWITKGMKQLEFESGGNEKAQNNSDSNAAKGTPSKGLMQVIDPTFAAYRSSIFANDIWNPSANIASALQYTVARYDSPENIWGQNKGYADGGWVLGDGGPRSDGIGIRVSPKEFVVNATSAQANAPWLEAINSGATLQPPSLPAGFGASTSNSQSVTRDHSVQFNAPVQVMDVDHLMRETDRWTAMQAQGAMAAL